MMDLDGSKPESSRGTTKWASFGVGVTLLVVGFFAFPAPPPAMGMGVFVLGMLLLFDWAWENSIGFAAWGGLELRSEEIVADFYSFEQAKWRYALALAISAIIASAFGLTDSFEVQVVALIGGVALFGVFGFIGILKSRRRIASTNSKA